MADRYIIIPGTDRHVYEGTVVVLNRLPNLKWILRYGYFNYNGRRRRNWYFASIPSDTEMPVFDEDLVNMVVLDDPVGPVPPVPPPGPYPPVPPGPHPPYPPVPPVPVPVPFTPQDKRELQSAMLTVEDLAERDKLSSSSLPNGKVVRVNDIDGHGKVEYYSWNEATSTWDLASLGYRYMTREEIEEAMGSSIVDIVWSDEEGSLVLTDHNADSRAVELTGVAHDIAYTQEELTIRIPIYGRPDVTIKIPEDKHLVAIRFEPEWTFPDGSVKPALVATVSDGETSEEIAGDATGIRNIYTGAETATATILISSESSEVKANVKLSSIVNNAIGVDNEGLYVDLSGYVGKQQIDEGFLLVADGLGQFTYAGSGVELDTTTAIADLTNPEKKVVTANLIADAINAAISALRLELTERISDLERRLNFGRGQEGEILITSGDSVRRGNATIGGSELSPTPTDALATEEAVKTALSWHSFNYK